MSLKKLPTKTTMVGRTNHLNQQEQLLELKITILEINPD